MKKLKGKLNVRSTKVSSKTSTGLKGSGSKYVVSSRRSGKSSNGNIRVHQSNKKVSGKTRDSDRKKGRGRKRDKEVEVLDEMLLNVFRQRRKRKRAIAKSKREEPELWEDFDEEDDVLDVEDIY